VKMTNDSTAVKVPVKTGVETTGKVEILSPEFSPKDKILVTGNFGLPDTALVVLPSNNPTSPEEKQASPSAKEK